MRTNNCNRKPRSANPDVGADWRVSQFNRLCLLGASVQLPNGRECIVVGDAYIYESRAVVPVAGLGLVRIDQLKMTDGSLDEFECADDGE